MLIERSELPLHQFWEMFQYHETILILKTGILIFLTFLRIVRFPKFELPILLKFLWALWILKMAFSKNIDFNHYLLGENNN